MPAIKQQERTLPSHSTGAKKEEGKKKKLRLTLKKINWKQASKFYGQMACFSRKEIYR